MRAVAALAAFASVWLVVSPGTLQRLRPARDVAPRWSARRWARALPGLMVPLATVAGGFAAQGAGAAIGFATTLAAGTSAMVWRRQRSRTAAAVGAAEVASASQLLAGMLRVGHVPATALRLAAREVPLLAEAAALHTAGGDVGEALRRRAGEPGRAGLRELAVAWEVAERSGASLTATLDAVSDRLVAQRKVRDVVAAELAASRATGRLLAVLPLVGLALGYAFGGDPVSFLIGSLPGQVTLALGTALGCAGVVWTERIADGVEG